MAETKFTGNFADDAEFLRRTFCYLERCITPDDFRVLQQELLAEPLRAQDPGGNVPVSYGCDRKISPGRNFSVI